MDRGGHADLTGLSAQRRKTGVEGLGAPLKRIDGKCARSDRGREHAFPQEESVERECCARLRSVDQREAFLGTELERFEAEPLERGSGADDFAGNIDPPITHQRRDQVRERREVTRGPYAALRRDQGHRVRIEQTLQSLDDERPNAGMSAA